MVKKILHICSYYINDAFYNNFFESLSKKGYNNFPYTFADKNQKRKERRLVGQVSYCFNTIDRFFFFKKHRKVWDDINSHRNLLQCDIVHAHSLFSNGYIAKRIWESFGIPYIVTVRYPDVLTFFKYMPHLRKTGKDILLDAKAIIFLSDTYCQYTMKYLLPAERQKILEKTYIIPNGIDDFWIENRLTTNRIAPQKNKLKILFVGKIDKNKNLETLIEICKLLQIDNIEVQLIVAGQIVTTNYNKLIKRYGFIKYVGVCDKNQLLKLYRIADIFILLSHKESFGLVYAEALTQGLPIIYTKGQGFYKQFSEGQVGFGVSDVDPSQAVEAIYKILGNYQEISHRALQLCTKFTWDDIVEKISNIYETKVNNDNNNQTL